MRLKIKSFGTDVEGIELKGDPRNPEPDHARIAFPGGDVDVTRTTDNEYWVHISVNRSDISSYDPCSATAEIVNARADSKLETIDLQETLRDCYHFAVRVGNIQPAKS